MDGCYRLVTQSTRQDIRVPESLIALCMRRDWLRRNGQDLVLSEAGRAWLSRCEAGADPFRQQHQRRAVKLREVDGARRQVMVNETESPLGWLKGRKDRAGRPLLSDPQYEAGERLRADYWFAQLNQRVTANWSALAPTDRSRRGAPPDAASLRDNVIAAKERVARAKGRRAGTRRRAHRCLLRVEGIGRSGEGPGLAAAGGKGRAADRADAARQTLRV